jgi:hypothetical protein
MHRPPRIVVLFVALIVLVLGIALEGKPRTDSSAGGSSTAPASQVAAGSVESNSAAPRPEIPSRPSLRKIVSDPFLPRSWLPPMKRISPAAASPAPAPPPLPYRFAGRLNQGAVTQVFLGRGDEIIPIKVGDTIDGQYRIESISESGVTLVHLPTGIRQLIEVDSSLSENETATGADAIPVEKPATPAPEVAH